MTNMRRCSVGLALYAMAATAGADSWLQSGHDASHSGNNTAETTIGAANVATLVLAYSAPFPGTDGPVVFLPQVATPNGVKDLLFATTDLGVAAVDAATGAAVWTQSTTRYEYSTGASPAVDPSGKFVYGPGSDGRVHKLAVGSGVETVDANWPVVVSLKTGPEKASSPLAIATTSSGSRFLYAATASYDDSGSYQGHVTSVDLATGNSTVFNAACSDLHVHFAANGTPGVDDCATTMNGIWSRAGVTFDPYNQRIFMSVGNGPFDADTGGYDWGDSVLALNPDGTGGTDAALPLDSYTPAEWQDLWMFNGDLGSSSPAVLPPLRGSVVAHAGIQIGKDGIVRLLDFDNLGGQHAPGSVGGELQKLALLPGGFGNYATPQPAVWTNVHGDGSTWVFASVQGVLSGLQVTVSNGQPLIVPRWSASAMANSSSPVVANDVLYAATSAGGIQALAPTSGSVLWSSAPIAGCCHAQSPIVVNGALYLATASTLVQFGVPKSHGRGKGHKGH